LFADTRNDVSQIDLLKGKGFLLSGDDNDFAENVHDKKIEPAVPDEKDQAQNNKRKKKNEQIPQKVNPG